MHDEEIKITSRDYWFKVVDFLQQNWALIDETADGAAIVYFFGDTSGIFDQMTFSSKAEAETSLRRNGFNLYEEDKKAQEFIAKPNPPFHRANHPNGLIYSSGKFWS
ncbi:MAG: hypothetical protein H0W58_04415 [Acidobacteria bacterium]|jgi:hypothetical protein|nr:hypothetical protein [Acidobacteriota bacterium]